jgi:PadR family transcriptional regulator, regulatory protein PadR
MENVRVTVAVAVVLRAFLDDVARPRYGYELMQLTGFPSGKLYPVLARLERAGWLTKEREHVDPVAAGRPVRRLYRISSDGARAARCELAALSRQLQEGPSRHEPLSSGGGRR